MKLFKLLFISMILGLFSLASCAPPVAPPDNPGDGLNTDTDVDGETPTTTDELPPGSATVNQMIGAIPDIGTLLPKSLQAGATTTTASANVRRISSRAAGDVTDIVPANLPGVTAEGYKRVKDQINDSMLKQVLELLKLGIGTREVTPGTDFVMGTVDLPEWFKGPNPDERTMDLGVIRLAKPSTTVTEIRWFLKIKQKNESYGSAAGASSVMEIPYYVYIQIDGLDVTTMKVKIAMKADMTFPADMPGGMGGQTVTMKQVVSYDAATKEMTTIQPAASSFMSGSIQKLNVGDDGFVRYYSLSDSYKQVAFANDAMGGVVNASSYQSNMGEESSIWNEFYNEKGDLVMTQWGQSSAESYSWVINQFIGEYAANVKTVLGGDKPATLYRKVDYSYNYSVYPYEISRTTSWSRDGTTWVGAEVQTTTDGWFTGGWTQPVWMTAASPAAGDSLYYYQSGDWNEGSYNGTTQTWTYSVTDTFKVGFTVPAKKTYLGKDYYIQNRFLLKYLSLAPEMATYKLKMKEGDTYYGYTDPTSGEWTYSNTKPAIWDTLGQWDRYSFTQFQFWLENDVYRDKDGVDVNDAALYDSEYGDISLDNLLREETFYIWENNTSKEYKTKVLDTTEDNPVGFTFGNTSLVDSVRTQIEAYYATIPELSTTDLQATADAILTLPALDTFPTY